MSNQLSGSRLQEDTAFAKRYLDQLSEHAVNYANDFVTPPEKRPRRMPVLSVSINIRGQRCAVRTTSIDNLAYVLLLAYPEHSWMLLILLKRRTQKAARTRTVSPAP